MDDPDRTSTPGSVEALPEITGLPAYRRPPGEMPRLQQDPPPPAAPPKMGVQTTLLKIALRDDPRFKSLLNDPLDPHQFDRLARELRDQYGDEFTVEKLKRRASGAPETSIVATPAVQAVKTRIRNRRIKIALGSLSMVVFIAVVLSLISGHPIWEWPAYFKNK